MMRMLPLNALLFGRYENAADDEKKKTKKKIHHDDTNNIPKTPLLLLSSSFCQRKRKPEQQRRLLKRASRENEKRKVCVARLFFFVFANLIDFFLLSFFCSSIKLERKSTLLDRHRRFRDRKRCLSPTRAVCEAALSSAALVGRRIRSFQTRINYSNIVSTHNDSNTNLTRSCCSGCSRARVESSTRGAHSRLRAQIYNT